MCGHKHRVVFNCFLTYEGENWNKLWLPGPTLTSRMIPFLLPLPEHAAGTGSDITWMFHQVQLLPEDKALLFAGRPDEGGQHRAFINGKGSRPAVLHSCCVEFRFDLSRPGGRLGLVAPEDQAG